MIQVYHPIKLWLIHLALTSYYSYIGVYMGVLDAYLSIYGALYAYLAGGIPTPLEKYEFVSWDYGIPKVCKHWKNLPSH